MLEIYFDLNRRTIFAVAGDDVRQPVFPLQIPEVCELPGAVKQHTHPGGNGAGLKIQQCIELIQTRKKQKEENV